MNKVLRKVSVSGYSPCFRFSERRPGLLARLRSFLERDSTSSSSFVHDRDHNSLAESNYYKYSVRDISSKEKPIPQSFTAERQQMREYEEELTNLEKIRLREFDKALGTNTYYHESKPYEERISSEIIMERKILKKIKEQHEESVLDRIFAFDPQEKRKAPKIRNFKQFVKEIEALRMFPEHQQQNHFQVTPHEKLLDFYSYLDLSEGNLPVSETNSINRDKELELLSKFLSSEDLYGEMSMLKYNKVEDNLIKEFQACYQVHNVLPLYYDKFIYYTKDPSTSIYRSADLFRTPVLKSLPGENSLVKVTDVLPENELHVLSFEQLREFLQSKCLEDPAVSDLYLNLFSENPSTGPFYNSIVFDKNHEAVAATFCLNERYFVVIKDLSSNKFWDLVLSDVAEDIAFTETGGLYYVRASNQEFNRKNCLCLREKANPSDELIVYEEKDLNFEIKVSATSGNNYMLLTRKSVSGSPLCEIWIKSLKVAEEPLLLLVSPQKGFKYTVNEAGGTLALLQTDGTNSEKKIFLLKPKEERSVVESKLRTELSPAETSREKLKEEIQINLPNLNLTKKKDKARDILEAIKDYEWKLLVESCEEEKIIDMECFEHYLAVHAVNKENRDKIKIYNFRTDKFHDLNMDEVFFKLEKEQPQRFQSPFLLFGVRTPHIPSRVYNYNMGLRKLELQHSESYPDYSPLDLTTERIEAEMRDGSKIPITLSYNKKLISARSPLILHVNCDDSLKEEMCFTPEKLSLFNRGIIYAYPHLRGSKLCGAEHFTQGSGEKRLTNISDLIDSSKFLVEKEIADRISLFGSGLLGGLAAMNCLLQAKDFYASSVIDNGLFDIFDYLRKSGNSKEAQTLFGNANDPLVHEHIKFYNPYTLRKPLSLENLLITSNFNSIWVHQSRKFVAKIRENKKNDSVYYREFDSGGIESIEKTSLQYAFLVGTLLLGR